MKAAIIRTIAMVSLTTLFLALSGQAYAEATSAAKSKTFQGTVLKVDDKDRTLTAKGFWFWSTETFNLGVSGKVLIGENKKEATLKDLAPGNRVEVLYS